jgi:N-acetylmuramoyl-L-alanine amidase
MFRNSFRWPAILLLCVTAVSAPVAGRARRPPLPSEPLTAMVDGKSRDLEAVMVDEVPCLPLRAIQKLFGGKHAWHRVARRVVYEVNGRSAIFVLDSTGAVVAGEDVALETAPRFWTGQVYIPLSFLTTKAFQEMTETTVHWDRAGQTLAVRAVPSVSSPEWHSSPGKTRVQVRLGRRVNYRVMDLRPARLVVRLLGGRAAGDEALEVKDGLVDAVRLERRGRSTDLVMELAAAAGPPILSLEEAPRRLAIDVLPRSDERPEDEDGLGVPGPPVGALPVPGLPDAPLALDMDTEESAPPVSPALLKHSPIKTIVIDPGHGGKDAGAVGPRGALEKDINLEIARALARQLKRDRRFKVILTRDGDEFIPLADRTKIGNGNKADLFVSIHCNAALSKDSHGFEIYFLSEHATDEMAAAVARRENAVIELEGAVGKAKQKVQDLIFWSMARTETLNESSEFAGIIGRQVKQRINMAHRGVKQAGFFVLKGAEMPAVLVESGFITHPDEESRLRSSRFQNKLVSALRAGILDYERRKIQARQAKSTEGGG